LLRASAVCSGFACLIGFRGDFQISLCAAIVFMILIAPEQTPFATCLALLLNLSAKSGSQVETVTELWPYMTLQILTLGLGGTYELIVLSDYGNHKKHGRSIWSFTGEALQESSFRKGKTKFGKWVRSYRNFLCQVCIVYVCLVDPMLQLNCLNLSASHLRLTAASVCKLFVVLLPILYTMSSMLEETR
jgi:hypothetical protein